jgi:hypothetical protein
LSSTTLTTPRVLLLRNVARLTARVVVDYFDYAGRPVASARCAAHRRLLRLAQARRRLRRLRSASGCFGRSRGSSSTTSPRAGSSSTASPTPRVRVPGHVVRLVKWPIVDYFASLRLVVDYFAYTASGCLGTSRGSSRGSSSTTSPRAGSLSNTSP